MIDAGQSYYADRFGVMIDKLKFDELSASPEYRVVRRYKRGQYDIYLTWFGVAPKNLYRLVIKSDGIVIETTFYPNAQQAIDNYEHFLVTHCGCEWVPSLMDHSKMMLLEIGNIYTNKPTQEHVNRAEFLSGIETNAEFGSW